MADSNNFDPIPALEDEIRRYETEHIASLSFSRDLEKRFQRETGAARARMLLVQGLLSLLAYDFFIVGDYFMAPANIERAAIVRFGIITPLVLLVAMLVKSRRSAFLRESATSILCVLGAISILYLHHDVSASVSVDAQTGLILVLLVANCMLRIDLPYAAATSVIITILDAISLVSDAQLPVSNKMVSGGMLAWVAMLTFTANYTMSRERRFSYLLQLRGRLQRRMLAEANAELLALSSTDRLTGLPNRRAYDTRLHELWQLSLERRHPISVVMVDVDHFKKLNDTHGHPYGDRVLQRVGSLLQQALRAEDDFVARFGGEEFVILLPDAEPHTAFKVAERIRTLVQVAGSPALQRDSIIPAQDVWATVSCGVATAWPTATLDPHRLIADADAAMYRAKREGRNRVCAAPLQHTTGKIAVFPAVAGRG
ncbi:diguanylate cyclase (GGDEF) domain-containing protein [Terriglobus roseus DSM 18391]|uniref:diguanylate cyclase n=1 Tax=Terriglobus roseus (strain DSM 18391 / NRRL B-41598 / KBS 63) TaxID=926566 RepID=I3ZCX3_TERRK|nr:GGDEF domain-containing protein [Terriglobus roseus]AFL87091.1 diguanylate cyclase (GGDEF) domain-containing protein [Terriglobus roseus DSM 18391]